MQESEVFQLRHVQFQSILEFAKVSYNLTIVWTLIDCVLSNFNNVSLMWPWLILSDRIDLLRLKLLRRKVSVKISDL